MKRVHSSIPTVSSKIKQTVPHGKHHRTKHDSEEIKQLQELVNVLRLQLSEAQNAMGGRREKENVQYGDGSSVLESELLRTQKQLADALQQNKGLYEAKEILETKLQATQGANHELSKELQNVVKQLNQEREIRNELEFSLHQLRDQQKNQSELNALVEELRSERDEIQKQYQSLLRNFDRLSTVREPSPSSKAHRLRSEELDGENASLKEEKIKLLRQLEDLQERLDESETRRHFLEEKFSNMGDSYSSMKQWLEFLENEMVERKFTMADLFHVIQKMNRARNLLSFSDFLENLLMHDQEFQRLKEELAITIQETEKLRKLLAMQEEISHEYKAEVARLKLLHSGVPEVLGEPVKAVEISEKLLISGVEFDMQLSDIIADAQISSPKNMTPLLFLVIVADSYMPICTPFWLFSDQIHALDFELKNLPGSISKLKLSLYLAFGMQYFEVAAISNWSLGSIVSEARPAIKLFSITDKSKTVARLYLSDSSR